MHDGETQDGPERLTQPIPSLVTARKALLPLWKVESHVLGTAFPHTWGGNAVDEGDARRQALAQARREWPGFSFCVRSILRVA